MLMELVLTMELTYMLLIKTTKDQLLSLVQVKMLYHHKQSGSMFTHGGPVIKFSLLQLERKLRLPLWTVKSHLTLLPFKPTMEDIVPTLPWVSPIGTPEAQHLQAKHWSGSSWFWSLWSWSWVLSAVSRNLEEKTRKIKPKRHLCRNREPTDS